MRIKPLKKAVGICSFTDFPKNVVYRTKYAYAPLFGKNLSPTACSLSYCERSFPSVTPLIAAMRR